MGKHQASPIRSIPEPHGAHSCLGLGGAGRGGPRTGIYPLLTAAGTSAQHLAAYKELLHKWFHVIFTTAWEEGGRVPIMQKRTPRLRKTWLPPLAWSTPAHLLCTSITPLGARRRADSQQTSRQLTPQPSCSGPPGRP